LIGSAKTGYSLDPDKYGNAFGPHSDLDIAIINERIFNILKEEFLLWVTQYNNGVVEPNNKKQAEYWVDNRKRVPQNIAKGYIDTISIPNYDSFPFTMKVNQIRWLLKVKILELTPINVDKVTIRVYNRWDSFFHRTKKNIDHCFEDLINM
jgi:hypothetical protein